MREQDQSEKLEDHDLIIPSLDEGPDWYGRLHIENPSGGRIAFVASRRISTSFLMKNRLSKEDFPKNVRVLLDVSHKATAFGVHLYWVSDLGSSGDPYTGNSQTISGECQTLIVGEWIDAVQPCALGVIIDLDGLHAVLNERKLLNADTISTELANQNFPNGAAIKLLYSESTSHNAREKVKRRSFHLELKFPAVLSAYQLIQDCQLLHDLTSILTGRVLRLGKMYIDIPHHNFRYSVEVRQAHVRWDDAQSDLGTLVRTSAKDLVDLYSRILMDPTGLANFVPPIIHSLRKDAYPEDILYWLLPILENLARRSIKSSQDDRSVALKEKFFSEVDTKLSLELQDFARKHLKVVSIKTPSLASVFSDYLNSFAQFGIIFPEDLAKRLTKRRGEMMHQGSLPASSLETDDLASYVRVACILGMLRELGFDLTTASSRLGRISHHFSYDDL